MTAENPHRGPAQTANYSSLEWPFPDKTVNPMDKQVKLMKSETGEYPNG